MSASKPSDAFQLRLPPDLREAVRRRAEANRRSLNSEILIIIEQVIGAVEGDAHGQRT